MILVNDLRAGEHGLFINPSAICHTKGEMPDRDQGYRGKGQRLQR